MFIVAYRLLNLLNDFEHDSTDVRVAESLLDILDEIENMSIDQVADKCHISKSTLSRFVKTIGFENYKQFRDDVRNETNKVGWHDYSEKIAMNKYIAQYGIESFLVGLSGEIKDLLSQIDRNQIQNLALAMYKHKKVAAFGLAHSEIVAMNFIYEIAGEGKYIRTYISDVKQEQYMKEAEEDTLFIIFSDSGQYIYKNNMKLLDQSRKFVRKTKGKIALITSNKEAAYDPCVDYPVLYHYTTKVGSHPIIERLLVELIIEEYHKLKIYKQNQNSIE